MLASPSAYHTFGVFTAIQYIRDFPIKYFAPVHDSSHRATRSLATAAIHALECCIRSHLYFKRIFVISFFDSSFMCLTFDSKNFRYIVTFVLNFSCAAHATTHTHKHTQRTEKIAPTKQIHNVSRKNNLSAHINRKKLIRKQIERRTIRRNNSML